MLLPALLLPLDLELPGHRTAQKPLGVVRTHKQISRNNKYNKYLENILTHLELQNIQAGNESK